MSVIPTTWSCRTLGRTVCLVFVIPFATVTDTSKAAAGSTTATYVYDTYAIGYAQTTIV